LESSQHVHSHSSRKPLKLFLLRFVHSNTYVAIPITAITLATYITVNHFDFNFYYITFLFFSTLFLYPLHRLIGIYLTIPVEYTPAQRQVDKKPLMARISVILGFIGLLFCVPKLSLQIWQLIIPLSLISIAYSLPLIPTGNGWKRLRDIPGIKIYAISVVVTLTTSTIPLILIESISSYDIWLLGIQRFFFILAITIPFDIRDAHLDKKWNLKTIPLLLNNEKAIRLSVSLLTLPTLIAFTQFYTSAVYGFEVVIGMVLSQIWATYIIILFKKHNAALYNAFMVEGTMVFYFAIITIMVVLRSIF